MLIILCEYCRLSETVSFYSFHADHIKSIKHGGLTTLQNLAYCCPDCNFFKGSDIATSLPQRDDFTRFFNPRIDIWKEHFEINNAEIIGKTDIGKATVRIFKFNEYDRLIFRNQLIILGRFP